jgi:hypothetical protein
MLRSSPAPHSIRYRQERAIMRPHREEAEDFDAEDDALAEGIEPTPGSLAHWVAEQYSGDDRFETVEILDPGQLEEEAVRVKLICDADTHFMVAVLADDAVVRVGLATEDKDLVARVEEAAEGVGGAFTDLLAGGIADADDLEHEVEHFHDDMDYFCSDVHYQRDEDLAADVLREEVIYYLDGFLAAFFDFVDEDDE